MILNDETTWPAEVVRYLEEHHDLFSAWELRKGHGAMPTRIARASPSEYDRAIYGLRTVLSAHTLHGYHCTRLREAEIQHIISNGMQLPNGAMLRERIRAIQEAGLIERHVADRLCQINQADEASRAGRIWFCFFPPHLAGQHEIERLLRSWGGEALYNSHERDPLTGPILKKIGTPCLIEADVPIASFRPHSFLEIHLYRQFLVNRGFETDESVHHPDCATCHIAAKSIRRIIRFSEPDFVALTNCNTWTHPLT